MMRAAVGDGRSLRRRRGPALAGLLWFATAAAAAEAGEPASGPYPPEPDGYRMEDYRSPTPLSLKGAEVVDTRAAAALWRAKAAVFIDTMPRDVKPANLPPDTIWRDKPREHIPGSAWLANVGYGAIGPDVTDYFRRGLEKLSGGDKAKPLLFYCMTACWMSWNAGKRAVEWGYKRVLWYPEGADGWSEAGLPLEAAKPFSLDPDAAATR